MSTLMNLLRRLAVLALLMLLLMNLYFIGARALLRVPQPKLFGYSHSIVLSGSMEPVFSAGDLLVYREQPEYMVGDIVLFEQNGVFITHRIIDEDQEGFVTKGDANNTSDKEPVRAEQIHGRMALVVPHVGNLLLFLRTPLGILILILTGLALWTLPVHLPYRKKGNYEA